MQDYFILNQITNPSTIDEISTELIRNLELTNNIKSKGMIK